MTSNLKSRGIKERQNPVNRLTEILIRKQLEQVDKVQQKSFIKEASCQKIITKPTFGHRNIQAGKSFSRLLGTSSNNGSIYFIDDNNGSSHLKVASSNDLKIHNMKMNSRGEIERLKTMDVTSLNDKRQSTESRWTLKNLVKRRQHETNLKRNVTSINNWDFLRKSDMVLTDDLTVKKVRLVRTRSEMEVKGNDDNNYNNINSNNNNIKSNTNNSNNYNNNINTFLQPACGDITTSNKQTPRRQNHCLSYNVLSKLQVPRKTTRFSSGTSEYNYSLPYWSYDINGCFAKLSMSKHSDNNYESKVKDFSKSLKKILQE